MIEVKLSDNRIWKFHEDICMSKLKAVGTEPKQGDAQEVIMAYNQKKICAFSFDPLLTEEMLNDLPSFDYMKLFKEVIIAYNTRMQNFLSPPKTKTN